MEGAQRAFLLGEIVGKAKHVFFGELQGLDLSAHDRMVTPTVTVVAQRRYDVVRVLTGQDRIVGCEGLVPFFAMTGAAGREFLSEGSRVGRRS